jgi:hypothetical protein
MSDKLELLKTELKEPLPEGYLSEERRNRILSSIANGVERASARIRRTRDAALKALYTTLRRTPPAGVVTLKNKLDAEEKKISEALDERTAEDKAANKEYDKAVAEAEKVLDAAKKAYSKSVNDARDVADKAKEKSAKDYNDVAVPASAKIEELKEDLVAAGFTTDSKERTGIRPLRRTKDENVLGGPLAEEKNAEAAAKLARLEDLESEVEVAVELGGTSLEERLTGISKTVTDIIEDAAPAKSAKKS